jgi:oxygen-independent coproporphyrinogen III oxidase
MNLVDKYNKAVPRYTSYPTVPYWSDAPDEEKWKSLVKNRFLQTNPQEGISLYIHLPFCESLCTYCACNTRITVNHRVETPYIDAVLKEWSLYRNLMAERPRIRELHLGGGTPTFFSPENLQRLVMGILHDSEICSGNNFSFEGHPANTTPEHLQVLFDLGFRRVSLGIQDFDPVVQDIINRYQTPAQVESVVNAARSIGYTSVNFDLVYGLPFQDLQTFISTLEKTIPLEPDRIALYSYAHVPWLKPGQRKFTEKDLPEGQVKRSLYETGRDTFLRAGYTEIGMDHFALPSDPLSSAVKTGKLHRNFMGYTDQYTELMISLGVSAIGDTWDGFCQNVKVVEAYQEKLSAGKFPVSKGHILSEEDMIIRRHLLEIMCKGETDWNSHHLKYQSIRDGLQRCRELEKDGLVILQPDNLKVTSAGQGFVRNICHCFDSRYWEKVPQATLFSTVA